MRRRMEEEEEGNEEEKMVEESFHIFPFSSFIHSLVFLFLSFPPFVSCSSFSPSCHELNNPSVSARVGGDRDIR